MSAPNPPKLFLSHDADYDYLQALQYGVVGEGQPERNWRGLSDQIGFLDERPGGRCLGFSIHPFSEFDELAAEHASIWDGPRFDAPLLGLSDVSAGEVVVAARAHFDGEGSFNRILFTLACAEEDPEDALGLWRACLASGDMMAHFALGYTYYDLGDFRRAYTHLRRYVELAPCQSWNWCWLGKGAAAIGELDEAKRAYERAIELEEDDEATDASELLEALAGGR